MIRRSVAVPPLAPPSFGNYLRSLVTSGVYYPLNEGGGTVARDLGPNARHGAYTGVTLAQPGLVGPAASFDGINDDVTVANHASLAIGTGEFSIVCLFQIRTISAAAHTLVYKRGEPNVNPTNMGFFLFLNGSGAGSTLSLLTDNGADAAVIATSDAALVAGKWYLAVAVRVGTTCTLWLNGVAQTTTATQAGDLTNTTALQFGYQATLGTNPADGWIQHAALLPARALNAYEIGRLARLARVGPP